ncbi:MAG TPA: T9SS type B sorting domain-containing protein [Chitinophagaceae bacterium]|nr:T9SS type B sorting domain-containing protein [Chitinophagaceae bacterium]
MQPPEATLLIAKHVRTFLISGLLLLLFPRTAFAQLTDSCSRQSSFQKTFRADGKQSLYDAIQFSNGDIVAVGMLAGANSDALAMRFSMTGQVIWATRYSSSKQDQLLRVKPTADGGIIACGHTESVTPGPYMLAVKFTGSGQVEWSTVLRTGSTYGDWATDIVQTSDGGYAMAASYNAYHHVTTDVMVIKLNASGAPQWSMKFDGGESDWATSVAAIGDTILVGGYHNTTPSSTHNSFLMKLRSSDGAMVWGQEYDRGGKDDRIMRMEAFPGGYVLSEQLSDDRFFSNTRHAGTIVNAAGDVSMSKRTQFTYYVQGTFMFRHTADNGLVGVANETYGDPRVFKLDANGNVQWKRIFPRTGDQQLHHIMQAKDGSYVAAGQFTNDYFVISSDVFLVKLDDNGNTTGCASDTIALTITDALPTVQPLNWNSYGPVTVTTYPVQFVATNPLLQVNELCTYSPSCAPAPSGCVTTFQKTYYGGGHDEGLNIMATPDKGSIVCGRTTSGTAGDQDGFLLKLSSDGLIQWSKKYGGNANDELHLITRTANGQYIVAGITRSFGHAQGSLWVMKTNDAGSVIWSRQYSGNGKERAKKIIELSNGHIVIAGNTNDSSAQNNAWLLQLSPDGNVAWSKQYDQGNNDGLNDVIQNGDTLVVTGYATVNKKIGVLAKLRVTDGSFIWAQQYTKQADWNIELTNLYSIPQGYAFNAWSNNSFKSTMFKVRANGQKFFEVRHNVSTASGYSIESFKMMGSKDTGFVFLVNDTTSRGYPLVAMVGAHGNGEWGRSFTDFGEQRMYGISHAGDRGYLMTGYFSNLSTTGNKRRIKVLHTDEVGRTGICTMNGGTPLTDTSYYNVAGFAWNSITDYTLVQSGSIAAQTSDYLLNISTDCAKTICDSSLSLSDSCSTTFKFDVTGPYNILTPMGIRTADGGYMVAGEYSYGASSAMLVKLASNGNIQWAKTFNDFRHFTSFHTLVNTSDGNVVALGPDSYVINHGVSDSILITKVDLSGQILWIKKFGAHSGSRNARIKATADGGFLLFINVNIGFPPVYNFVAKIDENGNIVWQRETRHDINNFIIRDVVVDGSTLYTVGDYYQFTHNSVELNKFDLNTGQRLYSVRMSAIGRHANAQRMFLVQDTLYITGSVLQDPVFAPYDYHYSIIKVNPQTSAIYSALEITAPNLQLGFYYPFDWPGARPFLIDRTPDSGFVFTHQASHAVDSGLVIGKLSKAGTLSWVKRYPAIKSTLPYTLKADGDRILIAGTTGHASDPYLRTGTFIRTDSLGNIKEGVASGTCYNIPVTGSVAPLTLTTSGGRSDSAPVSTFLRAIPFTPITKNIIVQVNADCAIPGNCDVLLLSGPDTICDFTAPIVFNTTRNTGCSNAVNWVIDTSYARIISRTDTSLTLQFKRAGQTTLVAQLNSGCRVILQSKTLFIPPLSQQVSLGADKTICPGNQVTLRAGPGYRLYLWQDGSTDSVLVVTQPGTYHVRVTDVCNRAAADTLIVAPALPFTVNLGPDISKCDTQSVTLSAPANYARYAWSPAYRITSLTDATVIVNPDTSTSYHVLVERADGCKAFDTIRVHVNYAPDINLGADTAFCTGEAILLDAGNDFVRYRWSTGDTTRQITASAKGIYTIQATDINNCLSRDTIEITGLYPLPAVDLGRDTFFCQNENHTFDAGNFETYVWQDGSTSRRFTATQVGKFWVSVTDIRSCRNTDTVEILRIASPPEGFLDSSATFCPYDKATLSSKGNYLQYRWSTGSISKSVQVNTPGRYWLEVTNADGCTNREYIEVEHAVCPSFIHFPNAFTPNNDRKHDTYKPVSQGNIIKYRFTIYNRWGQKVFETTDPSRAWDGTFGGKPQDSNAFVWTCTYQFAGEPEKNAKGTVMLVR